MIRSRQVVYRVRPTTGTDSYGDPFEDWTRPIRARLPGAVVQARDSEEKADGSSVRVTTVRSLYYRGAMELLASDRVEVDGRLHRVEGEPETHEGETVRYIVATLERVTGLG